jgi:deferrochelatase/peroxidase EfeB
MSSPQMGIFALGTSAHGYLELDATPGVSAEQLVRAVAALDEPRSTVGGANLVAGFSREQARLHRMLRRMAGAEDGIRDALTRYTTPLTGAYYVLPSVEALAAFAPPDAD